MHANHDGKKGKIGKKLNVNERTISENSLREKVSGSVAW